MKIRHKCIECKKKKNITTWYKGPTCDVCRRMSRPGYNFKQARRTARNKGVSWYIGFELYVSIVKSPCHYCKGKLGMWGSRLDRINPLKGYVKGNVVACCGGCNKFKSNILTQQETLVLIKILKRIRGSKLLWP